MKKYFVIFLSLFLIFFLPGICLAEDTSAERVYVRGEIREFTDMSEDQLAAIMNESIQNGLDLKLYDLPVHPVLVPPADKNFRLEIRFFGSMTEMLMALDAGMIDGACMPEFSGKYLLARNDDLRAGMFEFSNVKDTHEDRHLCAGFAAKDACPHVLLLNSEEHRNEMSWTFYSSGN